MLIKEYEEIVNSVDAPIIVLAGPGSGKTHLLGDRVKRLLDGGVNKNNITVLTYTSDANNEMISRLINPSEWDIAYENLPHISTMHSLGLSIIQEKPQQLKLRKTRLRVQDSDTIKRLLFRDAALILGYGEDQSIEACECKQYGDCNPSDDKATCKICGKYWQIMANCDMVDFDDQILLACRILEENPDILKKYQTQAQHLLVDEYQDINTAQFKLIELLSRESRNGLFAVGDDAQSIYAFRGARPEFILNFTDYFPGAKKATLRKSRRCPKKIMTAAFTILQKYYQDWIGKPKLEYLRGEGEQPLVYKTGNESSEAKKVAKIVSSGIKAKKDILILSPKSSIFPRIIEQLLRRGIYCDCGISFLPDRIEVAALYLRWVNSPDDNFLTRLLMEKLINDGAVKIPGANKKKLKSQSSIKRRVQVERDIANLWEQVSRKKSLFQQVIESDEQDGIIYDIGQLLTKLHETYHNHADCPGDFAKELAVSSGLWIEPEKLAEDLTEVTKLLTPSGIPIEGSVRLRTMRKAKGLGAQIVIIVGLENDMVPQPRSDIEEQARLFYVSMTRATENLYLFHSLRRERGKSFGPEFDEKPRSEFLDSLEIDSQWAP